MGSQGKVGSPERPGWTRSPGMGGGLSYRQTGRCQLEQPQRRGDLALLWGFNMGGLGRKRSGATLAGKRAGGPGSRVEVAHVRGKRIFVPREEAGLYSLW